MSPDLALITYGFVYLATCAAILVAIPLVARLAEWAFRTRQS